MLEKNPAIRSLSASLATPQISITSTAGSWAVSPAVSRRRDRPDGGVLRDADDGVLVEVASNQRRAPGSGPAASPGSPGVGLAAAGNPVAVHGVRRAGSRHLGRPRDSPRNHASRSGRRGGRPGLDGMGGGAGGA